MIFTSTSFLLFFSVFFLLYWFGFNRSLVLQNFLILVASYLFYGFWDYRFLALLLFSTGLDFFAGQKIHNSKNIQTKKYWLIFCVGINLGLLLFFKYYNFFVESFALMIRSFGMNANHNTLNIILPVGISFYTFHGLSYVFDIYNDKLKPTKNFVGYAAFVSFFPLLVAGPIERAGHLLQEFFIKRTFSYHLAILGMRQILWGLFKKVVIADNCGIEVDRIFDNYSSAPSTVLIYGSFLFAVQIYADFSGYSDIAIGLSRLLGFEILRNFSFPYFSRNIAEFWKRWHISLTSWFRDYLYIPLGGSMRGKSNQIRNTFIVFIVSGFWHGANFTFIAWGVLHALYFLPLLLNGNTRKYLAGQSNDARIRDFWKIIFTNILVIIGWIFFRSESIGDALFYFISIGKNLSYHPGQIFLLLLAPLTVGILFLFLLEWHSRAGSFGLSFLSRDNFYNKRWSRVTLYVTLSILIILNLPNISKSFIYFQF